MEEFGILTLPFVGTSLGAAMVFFLKEKMNRRLEKFLLGFASGVMIAASVWSLLIPAIEMEKARGKTAWFSAAAGFLSGVGFLLLLDWVVPYLRRRTDQTRERKQAGFQRVTMLVLAVTLHNLPEGMAVGVALAGALLEDTGMTLVGALALAIGIAIQNFPEGAIISMPLHSTGVSRGKAFWYGVLSGVVEPVGAGMTVLLAEQVVRILPLLLAFAAGAMIYVVVNELIPEAQTAECTRAGTIGAAVGFVLMMVLDVAV